MNRKKTKKTALQRYLFLIFQNLFFLNEEFFFELLHDPKCSSLIFTLKLVA